MVSSVIANGKRLTMNFIQITGRVCSVFLGIIFLTAAISKVGNYADFYLNLHFTSIWLRNGVAFILPGLELILGLALVADVFAREAALLSAVLLLTFVTYTLYGIFFSHPVVCDCFRGGIFSQLQPSGWMIILRDLSFLALNAGALCYNCSKKSVE